MDRTFEYYRKEIGEEYTSLTAEEALEIVRWEPDLNGEEKEGARTLIDYYGPRGKHPLPSFLFVSPMAFNRWRLIKKTMAEVGDRWVMHPLYKRIFTSKSAKKHV